MRQSRVLGRRQFLEREWRGGASVSVSEWERRRNTSCRRNSRQKTTDSTQLGVLTPVPTSLPDEPNIKTRCQLNSLVCLSLSFPFPSFFFPRPFAFPFSFFMPRCFWTKAFCFINPSIVGAQELGFWSVGWTTLFCSPSKVRVFLGFSYFHLSGIDWSSNGLLRNHWDSNLVVAKISRHDLPETRSLRRRRRRLLLLSSQ